MRVVWHSMPTYLKNDSLGPKALYIVLLLKTWGMSWLRGVHSSCLEAPNWLTTISQFRESLVIIVCSI